MTTESAKTIGWAAGLVVALVAMVWTLNRAETQEKEAARQYAAYGEEAKNHTADACLAGLVEVVPLPNGGVIAGGMKFPAGTKIEVHPRREGLEIVAVPGPGRSVHVFTCSDRD